MKKLLLFVLAAVAFAACEQAPIEEAQGVVMSDRSLDVSFEGADDTRIQLQNGKTVWTEGDHVSVFYRSTINEEWQFMGETGDRTGQIVPVDNSVNPPATHNHVVVAYPYSADYFYNTETHNVEASLPAVQNYINDSYGTNGNIMISSSEFNKVSLKSVCGWLKLQLTGDGEVVKSITLRGNDGEQVAGRIYVDSATATATLASAMGDAGDGEVGGTLVRPSTILAEVTLDCGEGVALGKNATAFYIALPPQTFEKGFTIEITDTEDFTMEQSTDKALIIERNHIQPMVAFEFINPATPSVPAPASNEIWYTATAKVEPTYDDAPTFGAFRVSNVWDSETKRGIIAFDGDVTMIGEYAFYNCDKLTSITLPECVTSIGKEAFYGCDGLTEFTIPDSVTTIGNQAFLNCTSLTSVNIGDSVTTIGNEAFYACDRLTEFAGKFAEDNGRILVVDGILIAFAPAGITEYNIPDGVTSIGEWAFGDCDSLTSVNIPDSVTTIGDYAFFYCGSLTSVNIPDSVTTIGNYAFEDCTSLTSVNIPDSVTKIGERAFRDCTSLTSVNIPNSVTTIGELAFYYCTSLKKVFCYATTPPSLGYDVFYKNASVRRIYVYEECVELYKSAWSSYKDSIFTNGKNCPDTTTIEYTTNDGNTITSSKLPIISNIYENGVGTLVYSGKQIPNDAFRDCTSLTSVTIPDSVTTIGNNAFYGCTSLTSVNIGDSLTTIGNEAFENCTSLKEFTGKFATEDGRSLIMDNTIIAYANASGTTYTIPDSVTKIGYSAFYNCDSLKSVNIPDSVTSIGEYAFGSCNSLISVYCKATTPPALGGTSVFDANGSDRKIYVPAESVEAYKSAYGWKNYASAIVGYDFENGVVVEPEQGTTINITDWKQFTGKYWNGYDDDSEFMFQGRSSDNTVEFMFDCYAYPRVSDKIAPEGTYTIAPWEAKDNYQGDTLIIMDQSYITYNTIKGNLAEGTLTVTHMRGQYYIEFDFIDTLGRHFTGSYTGQLTAGSTMNNP